MSLIWHMVGKDLRRLGWPVGLWLALILAHTLLVLGNLGSGKAILPAYEGLSYFVATWGVVVGSVGFILAAWLVMDDSLVSTQAFWRTRPIHGARLLAAKALAAFVMFSLLPVVVLTPVWLWCGFSAGEWAWSALDLMLQNALISAAAFALASVTATSGQFLVRWMGAVILLPVYTGYGLGLFAGPAGEINEGVHETRFWLVLALLLLTPLAMMVHQFLTRRARRSALIFCAGLLLLIPVKFGWSWDLSPLLFKFARRNIPAAMAADPQVKFEVKESQPLPINAAWSNVRWSGEITGAPAGAYLRLDSAGAVNWRKDQTQSPVSFRVVAGRLEGPPVQAVRAVAGLPAQAAEPRVWSIESRQPVDGGRLQADLYASLMRGRLLGELPLRVGAELRAGSSFTRITSIERVEDRVVVALEERDAWPSLQVGLHSNRNLPALRNTRPSADAFIVLDRSRDYGQQPAMRDIGTIQANSLMVGRRELTITPPTRMVDGVEQEVPGWEETAVIAKVRFTPDHPLVRSITP